MNVMFPRFFGGGNNFKFFEEENIGLDKDNIMNTMKQEAALIINKFSDEDMSLFMPILRDIDRKRRERLHKKFNEQLDEAKAWATSVGYKESDIPEIIKSVRREKKL